MNPPQLRDGVVLLGGFPSGGGTFAQRDPAAYPSILSGDIDQDDGPDFTNNDGNAYHVLTGSGVDASARLDGFTITAGNADGSFPDSSGGGLICISGSPSIANCSFQSNQAVYGGAIINDTGSSSSLDNCILWNNQEGAATNTPGASVAISNGSIPTYTHCLIANSGGSTSWNSALGTDPGNNIDVDPLFLLEVDPASAPVTGGDLRLTAGSPAIDAGTNALNSTSTDLAGNPRIQNGTIDLGAYEGGFSFSSLWNSDDDNDGSPFGIEQALGTNPNLWDSSNPANQYGPFFNGGGEHSFTLARNPAADAHTMWMLSRSTNLLTDNFQEIYRFDGRTGTETYDGNDITAVVNPTSISVTHTSLPTGIAFYRFEAIYAPAQ